MPVQGRASGPVVVAVPIDSGSTETHPNTPGSGLDQQLHFVELALEQAVLSSFSQEGLHRRLEAAAAAKAAQLERTLLELVAQRREISSAISEVQLQKARHEDDTARMRLETASRCEQVRRRSAALQMEHQLLALEQRELSKSQRKKRLMKAKPQEARSQDGPVLLATAVQKKRGVLRGMANIFVG